MGFNRHNSAITTKQQINRKNKLRVVFDENARKDFLTGFRKRKDERRQKAKEQIELNLKNEIKKIKSESRTKVRAGRGDFVVQISDFLMLSVQCVLCVFYSLLNIF